MKNNWGRGGCSFSPEMGRDMEPFIKGIGGFPIDNYKKMEERKNLFKYGMNFFYYTNRTLAMCHFSHIALKKSIKGNLFSSHGSP